MVPPNLHSTEMMASSRSRLLVHGKYVRILASRESTHSWGLRIEDRAVQPGRSAGNTVEGRAGMHHRRTRLIRGLGFAFGVRSLAERSHQLLGRLSGSDRFGNRSSDRRVGRETGYIAVAVLVVSESSHHASVKMLEHGIGRIPLPIGRRRGQRSRMSRRGTVDGHHGGRWGGWHIGFVVFLFHVGGVSVIPEVHEIGEVEVVFVFIFVVQLDFFVHDGTVRVDADERIKGLGGSRVVGSEVVVGDLVRSEDACEHDIAEGIVEHLVAHFAV